MAGCLEETRSIRKILSAIVSKSTTLFINPSSMDFTLSTLGCPASCISPLLGGSKRKQLAPPSLDTLPRVRLQQNQVCVAKDTTTERRTSFLSFFSSDSSLSVEDLHKSKSLEDDDTASTTSCSMSEEEEDEDLCTAAVSLQHQHQKSVSFDPCLVTAVYTRPRTTPDDKYYLHYNEVDYLDFKIGAITGHDRTRRVSFARNVVSQVEILPNDDKQDKHLFYYSEEELQRFLNDFVQSLQGRR